MPEPTPDRFDPTAIDFLLLQRIVEATADVLWVVDLDTRRLVYLSPAYAQVFGDAPDRVLADLDHWHAMLHPDDRPAARAVLARVAAGERTEIEYRIFRASDGALRWIRDTGFPVAGSNGSRCAAGFARDVTDRRAAMLTAQLAARRAHLLAEAGGVFAASFPQAAAALPRVAELAVRALADSCCFDLPPDGDADPSMLAPTASASADPALAAPLGALFGQDGPAYVLRRQAMETGEAVHRPAVEADWAERVPGLHAVLVVPLPGVSPVRSCGTLTLCRTARSPEPFDAADLEVARDLARQAALAFAADRLHAAAGRETAERSRTEAALRDSERRLQLALSVAHAGAWEVDPGSGESVWDRAGQALFDLPPRLPFADALTRFVHPADLARMTTTVAAAFDPGGRGRYACRHRLRPPSGQEGAPERWVESVGQVIFAGVGAERHATRLICISMDVTELQVAEAKREMLTGELNHRVKNTLATVLSLAHHTVRAAPAIGEFLASFEARLGALAGAHDLLTREGWGGAALSDVARSALAAQLEQGRLALSGEPLRVGPRAAVTLAIALHELAVNAAQHGALSHPEGRVWLDWRADAAAPGRGLLLWREEGGPPIAGSPGRQGFGHRLLERGLRHELGAPAVREWLPEGLRCRIGIPLA